MKNTLIQIWKNKGKILEGITNSVFKNEHVEEVAAQRQAICDSCEFIDKTGKSCVVPGTQPCCGACGCSLALKLRSLSSACDKQKWEAVVTQEEEDMIKSQIES